MVNRDIILPKNKHFFLFGPRQTGKSTLLKEKFYSQKSLYYDLLLSDVYRKLAAHPEILRQEIEAGIQKEVISHVIIDEIQKIPLLLDEIHSLIESNCKCIFILSGSSARKLKRAQANMLGGRAWTFHLFPFIYKEIQDTFNLQDVLRYGTIPGVYFEDNESKKEVLRSYVNTYIKEEIEIEADIRNISGFLRFLPIAGAQNCEILNYTNMARETGVQYKTVRDYYQILEDTLLGFYLLPYNKSIRKKMVKHPKFYFFDTGIVRTINGKLNIPVPENDYEYGKAFEHFIICEIHRINEYKRKDFKISFYRTEKGAEVDCIIETPQGRIIAAEIKSTRHPNSTLCSGLRSFKEKIDKAELILACRVDHARKINDVLAMPWEEFIEYIYSLN